MLGLVQAEARAEAEARQCHDRAEVRSRRGHGTRPRPRPSLGLGLVDCPRLGTFGTSQSILYLWQRVRKACVSPITIIKLSGIEAKGRDDTQVPDDRGHLSEVRGGTLPVYHTGTPPWVPVLYPLLFRPSVHRVLHEPSRRGGHANLRL